MICPKVPPTSWRYSPCHYSCRPPCRIPRRVLPALPRSRADSPTHWWALSNQPWQLQAVWSCPKIGDTPQHMLLNYLESYVFQPIKFMGSSREFSDQYFISCCWLILYSDKWYSIRRGTDISRKSTEFQITPRNTRTNMGLSENVVYPKKPNGFADHYPYEKWLFHWWYTPFPDISHMNKP